MGLKFISFDEAMKALNVCLQNRDPEGVFKAMVDIENAVSRIYRQMAEANLIAMEAKEDAALVAKQNANAGAYLSGNGEILDHHAVITMLSLQQAHDPQMICEAAGKKMVEEMMTIYKAKQEQGIV